MTEKLKTLGAFVEALRRSIGFNFNINRFDHRLKLQKLVYLANVMGVPKLEYSFNLYLHGPYSPELAQDYYTLGNDFNVDEEEVKTFLGNGAFCKLIELAADKDGTWLEIATTLIELRGVIDNLIRLGLVEDDEEKALINLTHSRKPFVSRRYIKAVLDVLKSYRVT